MVKYSPYYNKIIDKKELKTLIRRAFRNYGIAAASNMADSLKDLGFQFATKAGFSLSLEDLRIPPYKQDLLSQTYSSIRLAEHKYLRGEITAVERFQKVIDTWSNASETLKNEVITYFRNTDPLNPVYIMAFSGARGNISQVRQLVGMRGLMSDPSGQIIDIPIASNFREGLTVTEYFISSYGARKGLVDTALRTADSGYLTRRLVDVAQDVIIRETDCRTKRGIPILNPNIARLLGRVLVENIYDPLTGALVGSAGKDIDLNLADDIINSKLPQLLVRSPLTCESTNSICQYCYGWSLAHDRLVDLGEAVGIIAAQSIGEPGTQLTMRTFHTGGVFTGEIAKQISSKSSGIIIFNKTIRLTATRTRHGEVGFITSEVMKITIQNKKDNFEQEIILPEGSILFIQDNEKVNKDQLIAEHPIGKRLGKEKAYRNIATDIAGQVYFTDLTIEETQNKQHVKKVSQAGGLIWILSGKVYNIPYNAEIIVKENNQIIKGQTLAHIKTMNCHSGKVFIPEDNRQFKPLQEIHIITSLITYSKLRIYTDRLDSNKVHVLETSIGDKFILRNLPNNKLYHYQIIADLVADTYKTQTGGMIKYLDLPVVKCNTGNQYNFEIQGGGYILWVEEETHEINKDVSLLLVKEGEFVEEGTEIVKNIFCRNGGMIEIIQKDDIIREIIIKPGRLISIKENSILKKKKKGFLRPGESLLDIFEANNIVYWEYLTIDEQVFILIRPVSVYSVPDSIPSLEHEFSESSSEGLGLKITRNICFKDGEKVKSIEGVELVKTQLVTIIPEIESNLTTKIILEQNLENKENASLLYQLKLVILETLSIDNKSHQRYDNQTTVLLVQNDQFVEKNTIIAKTEIISQEEGEIHAIHQDEQQNKRILNLTEENFQHLKSKNLHERLSESQWIRTGDTLIDNYHSPCSGQVTSVYKDNAIVRKARPYLLSPNTILYINNKDLVQQGESLAGLTYEVFKTGDIVQGLPRIEEILEVRKKTEGHNNPHTLLENKFAKYISNKLDMQDAVRLSMQEIQLFLIEAIQGVYRSQGVEIADKHIEIIVKQMSSKVKITSGGDTSYLPGDLVEVQKTEQQNETIKSLSKEPSSYTPLLLGITKASLNTESFISAASFQETTKILTEAAISGKLDWLKGLKENVIIGRLIPAGTGFGTHASNSHINEMYSNSNLSDKKEPISVKSTIDDIILDDRSLRDYPFHNLN
uniref:RNA polymerase beta'' subunit n=1 Tax=Goniotrichopsis reniformis TaxID=468933 RepID=UPI001FCDF06F|nr:RNA polymerase beta'' subunit [Goniotrichopsis reniformis]UNJ14842.1 RNA polymerase beta'' subunit [Goniotrichopsis reniformis]